MVEVLERRRVATEPATAQMPVCTKYHSDVNSNCTGRCTRREGHDDQHLCGKCNTWF